MISWSGNGFQEMKQSTKKRLECADWHYRAIKLDKSEERAFRRWMKENTVDGYNLEAMYLYIPKFTEAGHWTHFRGFQVWLKSDDDFLLFKLRWLDWFM